MFCQLAPTREVQRQSCVPLRGLHVYQLHFLFMQRLAACTVYLVQDYLFCKIAENLVESFPTARHVSDYGHFLGLRRYSPPKIRVRRSYGFYEDFPFALICFIVS